MVFIVKYCSFIIACGVVIYEELHLDVIILINRIFPRNDVCHCPAVIFHTDLVVGKIIAIGIPTVVETAVVVNDALDIFIEKLQQEAKSNDYLNQLKEEDNYEQIKEALLPKEFNFIVTPKEIDELILNMSSVVAKGINMAL